MRYVLAAALLALAIVQAVSVWRTNRRLRRDIREAERAIDEEVRRA